MTSLGPPPERHRTSASVRPLESIPAKKETIASIPFTRIQSQVPSLGSRKPFIRKNLLTLNEQNVVRPKPRSYVERQYTVREPPSTPDGPSKFHYLKRKTLLYNPPRAMGPQLKKKPKYTSIPSVNYTPTKKIDTSILARPTTPAIKNQKGNRCTKDEFSFEYPKGHNHISKDSIFFEQHKNHKDNILSEQPKDHKDNILSEQPKDHKDNILSEQPNVHDKEKYKLCYQKALKIDSLVDAFAKKTGIKFNSKLADTIPKSLDSKKEQFCEDRPIKLKANLVVIDKFEPTTVSEKLPIRTESLTKDDISIQKENIPLIQSVDPYFKMNQHFGKLLDIVQSKFKKNNDNITDIQADLSFSHHLLDKTSDSLTVPNIISRKIGPDSPTRKRILVRNILNQSLLNTENTLSDHPISGSNEMSEGKKFHQLVENVVQSTNDEEALFDDLTHNHNAVIENSSESYISEKNRKQKKSSSSSRKGKENITPSKSKKKNSAGFVSETLPTGAKFFDEAISTSSCVLEDNRMSVIYDAPGNAYTAVITEICGITDASKSSPKQSPHYSEPVSDHSIILNTINNDVLKQIREANLSINSKAISATSSLDFDKDYQVLSSDCEPRLQAEIKGTAQQESESIVFFADKELDFSQKSVSIIEDMSFSDFPDDYLIFENKLDVADDALRQELSKPEEKNNYKAGRAFEDDSAGNLSARQDTKIIEESSAIIKTESYADDIEKHFSHNMDETRIGKIEANIASVDIHFRCDGMIPEKCLSSQRIQSEYHEDELPQKHDSESIQSILLLNKSASQDIEKKALSIELTHMELRTPSEIVNNDAIPFMPRVSSVDFEISKIGAPELPTGTYSLDEDVCNAAVIEETDLLKGDITPTKKMPTSRRASLENLSRSNSMVHVEHNKELALEYAAWKNGIEKLGEELASLRPTASYKSVQIKPSDLMDLEVVNAFDSQGISTLKRSDSNVSEFSVDHVEVLEESRPQYLLELESLAENVSGIHVPSFYKNFAVAMDDQAPSNANLFHKADWEPFHSIESPQKDIVPSEISIKSSIIQKEPSSLYRKLADDVNSVKPGELYRKIVIKPIEDGALEQLITNIPARKISLKDIVISDIDYNLLELESLSPKLDIPTTIDTMKNYQSNDYDDLEEFDDYSPENESVHIPEVTIENELTQDILSSIQNRKEDAVALDTGSEIAINTIYDHSISDIASVVEDLTESIFNIPNYITVSNSVQEDFEKHALSTIQEVTEPESIQMLDGKSTVVSEAYNGAIIDNTSRIVGHDVRHSCDASSELLESLLDKLDIDIAEDILISEEQNKEDFEVAVETLGILVEKTHPQSKAIEIDIPFVATKSAVIDVPSEENCLSISSFDDIIECSPSESSVFVGKKSFEDAPMFDIDVSNIDNTSSLSNNGPVAVVEENIQFNTDLDPVGEDFDQDKLLPITEPCSEIIEEDQVLSSGLLSSVDMADLLGESSQVDTKNGLHSDYLKETSVIQTDLFSSIEYNSSDRGLSQESILVSYQSLTIAGEDNIKIGEMVAHSDTSVLEKTVDLTSSLQEKENSSIVKLVSSISPSIKYVDDAKELSHQPQFCTQFLDQPPSESNPESKIADIEIKARLTDEISGDVKPIIDFNHLTPEIKEMVTNGTIADLILKDLFKESTVKISSEKQKPVQIEDLTINLPLSNFDIQTAKLGTNELTEGCPLNLIGFEEKDTLLYDNNSPELLISPTSSCFESAILAQNSTKILQMSDLSVNSTQSTEQRAFEFQENIPKSPNSSFSNSSNDDDAPLTPQVKDHLLEFVKIITPLQGAELQRTLINHYLSNLHFIDVNHQVSLDVNMADELCITVMSSFLDNHAYIALEVLEEALEEARLFIQRARRNLVMLKSDLTSDIISRAKLDMVEWFQTCSRSNKTDTVVSKSVRMLEYDFDECVKMETEPYKEMLVTLIYNEVMDDTAECMMALDDDWKE